jgi:hypothetical protein
MNRVNPLAPPAYNGLSGDYPNGYVDVDFTYVYNIALTANQFLRDQVLALSTDADFVWRALISSSSTGVYAVRFSDSQGYYLSNGMIPNANFLYGTVPIPYPIFPEIVLPAGGRIGIDIQDLSAAPNAVEITFRGVKRYRLPAAA